MSVIVTDSYQTESILIDSALLETQGMNEETIRGELQLLSNFLNQHLKGLTLSEIAALNWGEIDQEFTQYTDFLKILCQELSRGFKPKSYTPMVIHGIAEVLHQPEFSQIQQVQTLLYLLEEEPEQLAPIVFSFPEAATVEPGKQLSQNSNSKTKNKVTVKIGSENPLEPMQICTLISANYYQDDIPVGSVGVIGPTRMVYENAIALVETTAEYLSEAFKN